MFPIKKCSGTLSESSFLHSSSNQHDVVVGPSLDQGLAKFFCNGPDSRHFEFCGLDDLSGLLNFALVA